MAGLSHGRLQACGVRRASTQPDVEETLAQRRSQACLATPSTPVSAEAIPVSAERFRLWWLTAGATTSLLTARHRADSAGRETRVAVELSRRACPDLGKHAVAMCFPDPPSRGQVPIDHQTDSALTPCRSRTTADGRGALAGYMRVGERPSLLSGRQRLTPTAWS